MAAATTAAQLRGSAPATARRRWPAPSGATLRFAPLARGPLHLHGLSASVASKPLTTMCMKAEYASTPIDPTVAVEVEAPSNEDIDRDQEVVPQKKGAIIHDFCLGIPFGGLLFSMGLVGFLFSRSPASLTFGVAPGIAVLALGVLSLKVWRSGKSSLPFILAQGAIAAGVAWKHFQVYTTTKKLLPWGFYTGLSAAMICFYAYVLLAGGNPAPKKKAVAAP